MKPKRKLMTEDICGKVVYFCQKCGQPMRHVETSDTSFSAGEVCEVGEEYLFCDTCGTRSAYPAIPDHYCTLDA